MEPPSSTRVSVIANPTEELCVFGIEEAIAAVLARESVNGAEVRVLLTSDDEIRKLNRRFRAIDEPTDVLTFPDGEGSGGDIAISLPRAARQAACRGISAEHEVLLLAIHGALHLVGYDDDTDEDRDLMVAQMNGVASELGLPPLEDWSSIHVEATA